jgi:hypothetical protein
MPTITRRMIADENRQMLKRQARFRVAADVVTTALLHFPEVEEIALVGSVARPLWPEVPRFSGFRQQRVEIWHECKDVDLAVWLNRLDCLRAINRARNLSVQQVIGMTGVGVANHEVEIFILEPGSNRYLSRICNFDQCPKGHRACQVPGCGREDFLQQHDGFALWGNALDEDRIMRLYRRPDGIIRRAADTPASGQSIRDPPATSHSGGSEASFQA